MWSPRSLLFTLCIAVSFVTRAGALISVYGYEGKDVHVPCPYGAGYESYVKYFCKNDCYDDNDVVIKTQANKAKYSIHDNKTRQVFTVTISDLSQTDAGKYWCVVERNGKDWYTEVKLEVSKDTCCDKSTKVQTHEDASVSFICPYESKDENNLKYICRGNQTSICLQQALVKSTSPQNGRFRLTDDKASRRFTVTITNLTQGDTGSYLCGAHRDPGLDVFTAVDLDVKEWCCVRTNQLNGTMGRPLTLRCPYPQQHKDNRKFLCKGDHRMSCTDMVTSQSRFTLQENVSSSSFSVMVTELQAGDAGTYWCGSDSQWSPEQYTKIQLSVDTCCGKSTKVQMHEDASVSFTCPYESKDENNLKYICRGNQTSICLQQALVKSTSPQNGRFRLTDDKASRRFTVTITNLTQGDTGSYLCGAHRDPGLDVFTAVDLDVKEWCCVRTNQLNGTVGRPLTLQCPYPQQHKDNRKFLCKGDHRMSCTDMVTSQSRFTLQENVSSSSFSVMVTELQAGDAGTYWCGSDSQWSPEQYTKIQLSVVGPQLSSTVIPLTATEELNITEIKDAPATLTVVFTISAVLLILTVALIVACKYKCHKVQGAGNNMNMDMDKIRNKTAALEAEEVMGGEDVYENHDIVANSKQGTSYNDYDDAGDDSMYQNFSTADDIYCNQVYVTAKR